MNTLVRPSRRRRRRGSSRVRGATACLFAALAATITCATTSARAAAAAPPDAEQVDETAPASLEPPLTPNQDADLRFLGSVLRSATTDAQTGAQAAARLLEMDLPRATRMVESAIRSGELPVMLAALTAVANRSLPVPELLDATVDALPTARPEVLPLLSRALATYHEAAFVRVAAIADDRTLPEPNRLAAVHALGAFPTVDSGDELMRLADPDRAEPPAIQAAALESMRRLAAADLGRTYGPWQRWWREARTSSPERWATELVRQYQARNAELANRNDALVERYVDLLRELYRSLPVNPGQMERLPRDLEDQLVAVRAYALSRLERLLRDSVVVSEEVRTQLAARLDDDEPALRIQAARLLDALDWPDLAEQIAAKLPAERDPTVVRHALELLAVRPTASAFDPVLARLGVEESAAPAALAMWRLLRSAPDAVSAEQTERLRAVVLPAVSAPGPGASEGTPPVAPGVLRLRAFLMDDDALAGIEPRLDAPDEAVRSAVAEGLAARGVQDPLLARADDPVIYPWALRSFAAVPADLRQLETIVGLVPTESTRDIWEDAVQSLVAGLDPAMCLEVDRILAAASHARGSLRTRIMARAVVTTPERLTPEVRAALAVRLAPLLIEQGDPRRAFEILDGIEDGARTPEVRDARFRAALMAGLFEAAAELHDDPEPWLDLVETLADDEAASRILVEIDRRFGDRIDPALRSRLDAASALRASAAVDAGTESGP